MTKRNEIPAAGKAVIKAAEILRELRYAWLRSGRYRKQANGVEIIREPGLFAFQWDALRVIKKRLWQMRAQNGWAGDSLPVALPLYAAWAGVETAELEWWVKWTWMQVTEIGGERFIFPQDAALLEWWPEGEFTELRRPPTPAAVPLPVEDYAELAGVTVRAVEEWGRRGWIGICNAGGVRCVSHEAMVKFMQRARSGEFQRTVSAGIDTGASVGSLNF